MTGGYQHFGGTCCLHRQGSTSTLKMTIAYVLRSWPPTSLYCVITHLHGRKNSQISYILRLIIIKMSSIFWDTPLCSSLRINRRFGGECHLHLQGRRIRARAHQGNWQPQLPRIVEEMAPQLAEDWKTQLPGNWASQSSHSCVAA
jgi:hypothetical protein